MKKKVNIENLFPNPLFLFTDFISVDILPDLRKDCYKWRELDPGIQSSNLDGWHSSRTLFKRDEVSFKNLNNSFVEAANFAAKHIAPNLDLSKYNSTCHGWINISGKDSFNTPHYHPGSTLSGVYYLQLINSDSNSTSGCIQFLDPRSGTQSFSQGVSALSQAFSPNRNFKPIENSLIIFPSWLSHWVYPTKEEGERISIAFNLKYSLN